ncbi:MAG: DNA alkylation repair protein [Clostridia bacterium]|nr:DNA alkylation repair protein [Clostridia bacterium]
MQENVKKKLFEMQDLQYKGFHSKLMPTVNSDKIIGVRVPVLRKFAKEFCKSPDAAEFIKILPHEYYEENNLHAFIIEQIKDYDETVNELNRFLPFVDNWATCDMLTPKSFKHNTDRLIEQINIWLLSEHIYAVRFAVNMLMKFYLDAEFKEEYLNKVADIKSDEYYLKMVQAWYFATALAKQWDSAVIIVEENRLDQWTHNKTIQKAVESYRITKEQKEYLKTLKRKP